MLLDREALHLIRQDVAQALNVQDQAFSVRAVSVDTRKPAVGMHVCFPSGERLFAKHFPKGEIRFQAPRIMPSSQYLEEEIPVHSRAVAIEQEWHGLESAQQLSSVGVVPRPVAKTDATIVCEYVAGHSVARLLRILSLRPGSSASILRACGSWLRTLHDEMALGDEEIRLDEMLGVLERFGGPFEGVMRTYVRRAEAALEEVAMRLETPHPRARTSWTHGDFCPRNVLYRPAGGVIAVIDFEHFHPRTVVHDLAVMLASIRMQSLAPWNRARSVGALEAAFIGGYARREREPEILLASGVATAWILSRLAAKFHVAGPRRAAATVAGLVGAGFSSKHLEKPSWDLAK